MKKVSIIVPVYNPQEKHLKQCIDSLVSQTYEDIEIILVDNQSTDNNPQILQEYAEKFNKIKLITLEKNQGFAGACNIALKESQGEYIDFVDSDDWLEKNAIELLVNKMQELNNPDMLFFCANVYDESKKRIHANDRKFLWDNIHPYFNSKIFHYKDIKHFIFASPSQAWNKFYRKDFIIKNDNYFDMELSSACADAFFSFNNYLNAKNFGILRENLYNYRINIKGSIVSGLSKKDCKYFMTPLIFAKKINELIEKHNLSIEESKYLVQINIQQLYYFYKIIHKKNKKNFYEGCQKFFNETNKKYYNKENIKSSGLGYWYQQICEFNYYIFCVKTFLFFITKNNPECIYFLAFQIYEKESWLEGDFLFIKKKYLLGLFKKIKKKKL